MEYNIDETVFEANIGKFTIRRDGYGWVYIVLDEGWRVWSEHGSYRDAENAALVYNDELNAKAQEK